MSHLGSWQEPIETTGDTGELFAIHAALVYSRNRRKAKVLLFSGRAHKKYPLESVLWDPETNALFTSQTWPGSGNDLFCAHHCFLDDGRLLVMGGTRNDSEDGIDTTYIFDPESETWRQVGDMAFERWYPTAVMLPSGEVLVFSGNIRSHTFHTHIAEEVEVFSKTLEKWTTLGTSARKKLQIYPSLHVVPAGPHAGKIFYSGTRWVRDHSFFFSGVHGNWSAPDTAVFDPSTNTWSEIGEHVHKNRSEGTSVLLPPAQQARVLVLGGGHNATDARPDTAEIIDLLREDPRWELTPKMTVKRTNVNAVILPDQTVFVCGGHQEWKKKDRHGFDDNPAEINHEDQVLECAIYDPFAVDPTQPWKVAASMTAPRQYHSVALLLPDGRVLAAGGIGFHNHDDIDIKTMEIYSPPYMTQTRPAITKAPDDVFYNQAFALTTPEAGNIDSVVLIRPSAVTHHTNTEQRLVSLEFEAGLILGGGNLLVTGPGDKNLAPPGDYMLFIVDGRRTPSVARFVRLRTGAPPPPVLHG